MKLDELVVVHAEESSYALGDGIRAVVLPHLLQDSQPLWSTTGHPWRVSTTIRQAGTEDDISSAKKSIEQTR